MDDYRPPLPTDCLLRLSKEECKLLYDFITHVDHPLSKETVVFLNKLETTLEDFI